MDKLTRVIKDCFAEMKTAKEIKASPEEIVQFMDKMVTLTEKLGKDLEKAESGYQTKSMEVIDALDTTRMQLQESNAKLRKAIGMITPGMQKVISDNAFWDWFKSGEGS